MHLMFIRLALPIVKKFAVITAFRYFQGVIYCNVVDIFCPWRLFVSALHAEH